MRDGRLKLDWKQDELEKLRNEIKESNRRTVFAICGATLLIGFFVLVGVNNPALELSAFRKMEWLLLSIGGISLYLSFSR
jgi:hypothetical protein